MGTIITRSDKEVLHFFDEMKRVSDLIDLPYYQIGGKILYRESDIVRLLEKNRKEAF